MGTSWNKAFKAMDNWGNNTTSDQLNRQQNVLNMLDKTNQDALRTVKFIQQIDNEISQIQDIMDENSNITGNKSAKQVRNEQYAMENAQKIRRNQIMAAMLAATYEAEVQPEFEERETQKGLSIGVADQYNPTTQDQELYTRPTGQECIQF
jgi:hypothetical protein